ncbi:MAG: RbsD/FucU domain-containing protein [Planctomycetota bacterium]|jgi:hypothetical protein
MVKSIVEKIWIITLIAVCTLSLLITGCSNNVSLGWQDRLEEELPVLGHRNWILIADSAYPAQGSPGIEIITTSDDQLYVAERVLRQVSFASHVQAKIYLDAELDYVSNADAPGIDDYRNHLNTLLKDYQVTKIPHEDLIARLDESAKAFKILVIKTPLTLPYTSVFLELDCGYWGPEKEKRLRQTISGAR